MTASAIDLYTFPLEASPETLESLESVLSQPERDRSKKFRFNHLRDSYIVAHGGLRRVLAHHSGLAPDTLSFQIGSRGKPSMDGLDFNLSHSGSYALIGVTSGCQIGVDIEKHRSMPDLFDIAARFFCPEELADLQSVPADCQVEAFFLCWTRKESYIKAIGEGLHAPLDQFQVSLKPDQLARFLHVNHDPAEAQAWSLHNLAAPPHYAAAIAYRSATPRAIRQHSIDSVDQLP